MELLVKKLTDALGEDVQLEVEPNISISDLYKDKKKLNISFSVKKKIAIAVKRNKIKRRLRQIFNDGIKQNLIKLEKSVLVIAHATMLNNEYKIIKETLFKDFEKIK